MKKALRDKLILELIEKELEEVDKKIAKLEAQKAMYKSGVKMVKQ